MVFVFEVVVECFLLLCVEFVGGVVGCMFWECW